MQRATFDADTRHELGTTSRCHATLRRKTEIQKIAVKRVELGADTARGTGSLLRLHATLRRETQTRKIYCETRGVARGYGA